MPHRFEAKGDFVERLNGPERREVIPPDEVIDRMDLSDQDELLDLGAGVGYFSIPVSSKVREVVAVDMEPKMLKALMDGAMERERTAGNEVAIDITPGRKAIVSSALISAWQKQVDHVFYLYLEDMRNASNPYPMIPYNLQHFVDLKEEVWK